MTKTREQAMARARGIWGPKKAWVEAPTKKELEKLARETLGYVLDGLTLVVRCPELLHLAPVQEAARKLYRPTAFATGPFRVGTLYNVPGFGWGREVKGSGWSWDEAFEEAELRIEKARKQLEGSA